MQTLRSHIRRAVDVLAKAGLDVRPVLRALGWVRSRAEMARWLAENPIGKLIDSRDSGFSSPVISITMVSRNRAHCIGDAIRSVQAQSLADWELIVIDDGSTDDTRDTVAKFTGDPRIHYVWQPPQGMAKARNHSLRLARGALIAYLDDDNLFYPDFLAAAVDTFSRKPDVDCLYGALVADIRSDRVTRISCDRFDREQLVRQNFIDMGQLVHRHELIERYGGIDESIEVACDWDLVLRLTHEKPAYRLPVLAIRYRAMDKNRMSDTRPFGLDYLKVRQKWFPVPKTPRLPRVLCVLSHDPPLNDRYVETEIGCMRRWGIDVEAWSEHEVASPRESTVPVHPGDLSEAIAAVNPDVLHIHGLNTAIAHSEVLATAGLPVTVWAPDFRPTDNQTHQLLRQGWMRRIYHPSPELADDGGCPKLRRQTVAFDTSLFRPAAEKDRRLVLLRTSAALAKSDLPFFFGLASRVPNHRFVLAVATRNRHEANVEELVAHWREVGAPGELLVDVPRDELVSLIERAGIFLHTAAPTDQGDASPIELPTSIAEAMATGGYILVRRDRGRLVEYAGDAGRAYRDLDHAAALIRTSARWSDDEWHQAWLRSVNRGFSNFADELALRPLFEDWCDILAERLLPAPLDA